MKKNFLMLVGAFVTTTVAAFSFVSAQNGFNNNQNLGFFGDVSVNVYCTFAGLVPGGEECNTNILVNDTSKTVGTETNNEGNTVFTPEKSNQVTQIINRSINNPAKVVYVQGPAGRDGKNGTTTIVYQTTIGGAAVGPTAYINPGPSNSPVFQTTVPGDIWQTFIHQLKWENANGDNANITNINATNTYSVNLTSVNASSTNLYSLFANLVNLISTNATITNSTSTNIFSENASIINATTTNLFAVWGNILDLLVNNATVTNATSTNLFATNGAILNATTSNLTSSNATLTNSTSTNLFSTNASITNATTTYFFAAWATFLNMFVENLTFTNATGTNLQVANASTTNFSATGTSVITNLFGTLATFTEATTTNLYATNSVLDNAEIKAGNATLTTLVSGNSTSTNLFSTNASITNATTTNLFAAWLMALNAMFTNLIATNATITNATSTNIATGRLTGNGTGDLVIGTNTNNDISFISNGIEVFRIQDSGNELTVTGTNDLYVGDDITGKDIFASTTVVTNATLTNATTTNLFAVSFKALNAIIDNLIATNILFENATGSNLQLVTLSTTDINATGTATVTNIFANNIVTNNFTATGTINLGTTTMTGSLIPFASTSWMTLGNLANPWSELYVSSSSVYIGGTKISNVNGVLNWGGTGINFASSTPTSTSTFGVVVASSTLSENIEAVYATITNATSTNLFSSMFTSLVSNLQDLLFANATGTNATTTNFFSSSIFGTNSVLGNATSTNLFTQIFVADSSTSTNLFATNLTAGTFVATEATTTSLYSAIANFLDLKFANATGTNLVATGNVNVANLVAGQATTTVLSTTVLIADNASVTNIVTNNVNSFAGNMTIGTLSNNLVSFVMNGAETMRLKATGDVSVTNSLAVGRATPSFLLHVGTSTSPSGTVARFSNIDGNCNVNPTAGGVSCTSDERLKKNFSDYSENILTQLKKVVVKEYNMLKQEEGTQKQVGYIAQNLETVFPWLVQTDEEGFKSVSYANMTPLLVLAINELANKFEALSESISTKKITTNELCFAQDLCFTEGEMREFKNYLNSKNIAPTPTTVPTQDPIIEGEGGEVIEEGGEAGGQEGDTNTQ